MNNPNSVIKLVENAIKNELFLYEDSSDWLAKPINTSEVKNRFKKYVIDKAKPVKSFTVKLPTTLSLTKAGSRKRHSCKEAKILGISIDGAVIHTPTKISATEGDKVTLNLMKSLKNKTSRVTTRIPGIEKLKGTVQIFNSKKEELNMSFSPITKKNKKDLEKFLKGLKTPVLR